MGWLLLILGIALWCAGHLFKRVAPERRAAMGNAGKGAVAAVLAVSILLMIIGFRMTPVVPVWSPPSWTIHLNNLLILIAIFMMSPAPKKGRLLAGMRHPMTMGFGLWAVAHLLVNGDLASILMFGGLLAWAVVTIKVVNAAEPGWTPGEPGTYGKDAMFLVASVVLMAVIAAIHTWLGYWPFPA
ncbi:MAG: NnrU family protein [Marinibacterium sp.]